MLVIGCPFPATARATSVGRVPSDTVNRVGGSSLPGFFRCLTVAVFSSPVAIDTNVTQLHSLVLPPVAYQPVAIANN